MSSEHSRSICEAGRELNIKLGFYTTGLAFAILVIAVIVPLSAARLWVCNIAQLVGFIAWIALIVSGLRGIRWLNWAHKRYDMMGIREEAHLQTGDWPAASPEEMHVVKEAENSQTDHYTFLVAGIILLAISRGIVAIGGMFSSSPTLGLWQ